MTQEFKQKQHARQATDETAELEAKVMRADAEKQERRAALDADVSDLLDEIDDLLEPNAQSFVEQYIQQGGQ